MPASARRAILLPVLALIAAAALPPAAGLAAPPPPVRQCAEWEPVEGVMIRWPLGINGALVAEMSEDVLVYVIILSHQIGQATSTFSAYGVDLDNVRWVTADSYSHWSRDWGPQCLFDGDGQWGIGDPWFDGYPWVPRGGRGYEDDDDTPAEFAAWLGGENLWQPPFYLTGGNWMVDGHGRGFCTEAQPGENDHLTEAQFRQGVLDWFGVHALTILPNYESYGIQHVDCVAKLLDEETILVKQVAPGHGDHDAIEALCDVLAAGTSCYGNPYRIVRVDCGPFGGVGTAAYTNSLILGGKMLVPVMGCEGDAPALQVIADAMPGYEVLGFAGSWYHYDALHCRTMGIFDRGMLRVDAAPPPAEIPFGPWPVRALVDDRSEAGLDAGGCALLWRLAGEPDFTELALVPLAAPDSFEAWIPALPPGSTVEYYVRARDLSGREETRPVVAPGALFRARVTSDPTAADGAPPPAVLRAWPRPFTERLRLALPAARGDAAVAIHDARGRLVRRLVLPGGRGAWDGRDARGRDLPAGIYLIRADDGEARAALKVVKLR